MKKKIRETRWATTRPASVFFDDLTTYNEILASQGTVRIETDRFSDVEIADFPGMKSQPPTSILMEARPADDPTAEVFMRLEIARNQFSIWVADERASLIGALDQIKAVIEKRTVPRYVAWFLIGLLFTSLGLISVGVLLRTETWLRALLIVGGVAGIAAVTRFPANSRVNIHLYPSFDHKTFWDRNFEALVVNLIVGAVGWPGNPGADGRSRAGPVAGYVLTDALP